jgi:hypothetical protein
LRKKEFSTDKIVSEKLAEVEQNGLVVNLLKILAILPGRFKCNSVLNPLVKVQLQFSVLYVIVQRVQVQLPNYTSRPMVLRHSRKATYEGMVLRHSYVGTS